MFKENLPKEIKRQRKEINRKMKLLDLLVEKMQRVIDMIKESLPEFDTYPLEDCLKKCKEMTRILRAQEGIETEEEKNLRTEIKRSETMNSVILRRTKLDMKDRQLLENWDSEMKKIVNSKGRSVNQSL